MGYAYLVYVTRNTEDSNPSVAGHMATGYVMETCKAILTTYAVNNFRRHKYEKQKHQRQWNILIPD